MKAATVNSSAKTGGTVHRFVLIGMTAAACLVHRPLHAEPFARATIDLNDRWRAKITAEGAMFGDPIDDPPGVETPGFNDGSWRVVTIPHNWMDYHEYRNVEKGTLYGTAWYRRRFTLDPRYEGKRIFLFFEGVSSYAAVYVNGAPIGEHKGGRTCFTLDMTEQVVFNGENTLAVRAHHPDKIEDLPWVGGGSFGAPFSEGSQPFGIHRPVSIIITDDVRIEPFGVHVWTPEISASRAAVRVRTEVRNYGAATREVSLRSAVLDDAGTETAAATQVLSLPAGVIDTFDQTFDPIANPHLWNGVADPYLHHLKSTLLVDGEARDEVTTSFGMRWISWPENSTENTSTFLLNGKPVFLNGTCERENLLGNDYAFTEEQISAQVRMIRAAGFNALRDGTNPHNLRYLDLFDRYGIVNWTQMASVIYFDNEAFKRNYRTLLREWVKERRNHPCVVLWGIQNESSLPNSFHAELTGIIREMDPTTSGQRLAVTCHGGRGSDWNIPQDWIGTYAGNYNSYDPPGRYGHGTLIGEYGAWIKLGAHADVNYGGSEVIQNETYQTQLLETKLRLGEQRKSLFCGHFQWAFASYPNPGRPTGLPQQEGHPGMVLSPVNAKGIMSCWRQPYDAFYMYRSNYASATTDPMVYIVSHTWPDRWSGPGVKNNIRVFSNCDEVELFNDYKSLSLGVKSRGGPGTHFTWNEVDIRYDILYAEGRVNGKTVATDVIVLDNLPKAPNTAAIDDNPAALTAGEEGKTYVARVNCGGPELTDPRGVLWRADRRFAGGQWGFLNWGDTHNYSQAGGKEWTNDPIRGTDHDALFQTFRFGRHLMRYRFTVPNGTYGLELYFVEPWYGTGDGPNAAGSAGWRMFDVAVEGKRVVDDLDIWSEAGHDRALKKVIPSVAVSDGVLDVTFPDGKVNQAVISAIAVAEGGLTPQAAVHAPHAGWPAAWNVVSVPGRGLRVDSGENAPATVELLLPDGRTVTRVTLNGGGSRLIPTGSGPNGLYLVRISTRHRAAVRNIMVLR